MVKLSVSHPMLKTSIGILSGEMPSVLRVVACVTQPRPSLCLFLPQATRPKLHPLVSHNTPRFACLIARPHAALCGGKLPLLAPLHPGAYEMTLRHGRGMAYLKCLKPLKHRDRISFGKAFNISYKMPQVPRLDKHLVSTCFNSERPKVWLYFSA